MRPIVAFDLDEVICNLSDGVHAALARRFDGYPHWSSWTNYSHFEAVGLDMDGFLKVLVEERVCETATVLPGAAEAVRAVREMDCLTAVVTARGYHPHAEEMTREWLDRQALEMDFVRIVGMSDSKTDVILDLGRVVAYVDDSPAHLHGLADRCFLGVLALNDRPWNQKEKDFYRITSLTQFAEAVRFSNPHFLAAAAA